MTKRVPTYRPPSVPTLRPKRSRPHDGFAGRKSKFTADRRWRATRMEQLSREPICRDCRDEGRIEPATEVHHIRKRADDPTSGSWLDLGNLVSLCKPCHSRRTARGE